MERDPAQVMQYFIAAEEAAEDILSDRAQMIDLDRRRNKTREAQRALQKAKAEKTWVCMGNMFLKLPKSETKKQLQKDFDELDSEISKLRKGLKDRVDKLNDVEHKDKIKGYHLSPLTPEEMQSVTDAL